MTSNDKQGDPDENLKHLDFSLSFNIRGGGVQSRTGKSFQSPGILVKAASGSDQNRRRDTDENLKFLDQSLSFKVPPAALFNDPENSPRISHSSTTSGLSERQHWETESAGRRSTSDALQGSVTVNIKPRKSGPQLDQLQPSSPRKSLALEGPWNYGKDYDFNGKRLRGDAPRKSWSVDIPPRRSYTGAEIVGGSHRRSSGLEGEPRKSWTARDELALKFDVAVTEQVGNKILPSPTGDKYTAHDPSPARVLDSTLPVTVKFEDIVYKATLKSQVRWWDVRKWGKNLQSGSRIQEKTILHGVTGVVHPGEMMGMLGPSGGGKTTLLQILAGRLEQTAGVFSYNDVAYMKSMSRRTGLVTQNDVLYPHLTVKETLECAALLRLPRTFSKEEKRRRAMEVIVELGLVKCLNTIVGGFGIRGVSGGERRRVSIGHEMLTDPSLLLLDEPTSGLDSTTALTIINTLRSLTYGGKTIITSIHQPSSIIYHMFDKLIVLSDGFPVFYGKGRGALDYFGSIGFQPSFATNPADFLLDLANGVTHKLENLNEDNQPPVILSADRMSEQQAGVKKALREAYVMHLLEESKLEMTNELKPITEAQREDTKGKRDWATSWWDQFVVLAVRALKERRHESLSGVRIWESVTIAIVCGLIWWRCPSNEIQDKIGLLFFSSTVWGFFPLFNSIFTFPLERRMIQKERGSGMYRLSAFFMAQSVCDIPLELFLPTVYIIIVYWMGGFKADALAFIFSWLALLFNVLVAQGLGLAIGAVCMDLKKSVAVASVMLLTFLLLGGFYTQRTSAVVEWIKYISFSYYCFKLEVISQFKPDDTYACGNGQRCLVANHPAVASIGLSGAKSSSLALLGLFVGFRLTCYLALKRTKD